MRPGLNKNSNSKSIWQFLYVYGGIGYLHHRIMHPKEGEYISRKPSGFVIWIIGVYLAAYIIADLRHEMAYTRLTSTFAAHAQTLSHDASDEMLQRFIDIQEDAIPTRPGLHPVDLFTYLSRKEPATDIVRDVERMAVHHLCNIEKSPFRVVHNLKAQNSALMFDHGKNVLRYFNHSKINELHMVSNEQSNFGGDNSDLEKLVVSDCKDIRVNFSDSKISNADISGSTLKFSGNPDTLTISNSIVELWVEDTIKVLQVENAIVMGQLNVDKLILREGSPVYLQGCQLRVKEFYQISYENARRYRLKLVDRPEEFITEIHDLEVSCFDSQINGEPLHEIKTWDEYLDNLKNTPIESEFDEATLAYLEKRRDPINQ